MNMKKGVFVLALVSLLIFGCLGKFGAKPNEYTICVKNKYIDPSDDGSHYLIVTSDRELFEVDRVMLNFDKNPDLVYSEMTIGKIYKIQTTGYRINAFYNYPLIQSIEDLGNCTR